MRSLTALTVCMWMSSSDNEGSLYSYAVSSQDVELLIYYERYFMLFVGGEKRLGIQSVYSTVVRVERNFKAKNFRRTFESPLFPLITESPHIRLECE